MVDEQINGYGITGSGWQWLRKPKQQQEPWCFLWPDDDDDDGLALWIH